MRNIFIRFPKILLVFLLMTTLSVVLDAQSGAPKEQDQSIPDAPSAVQPAKPAPPSPPQQEAPSQDTVPPAPAKPTAGSTNETPAANPGPPPINIRTVPEGGATQEKPAGQDDLFTFYSYSNEVVVPVAVKDESGRLLNGLTAKDFTVLEGGKKQTLNFFTSDPFALSAAVVLDFGMKDVDVQKIQHTFPALQGVFSQFDELSLYTYSNAVSQKTDWTAVGQQLAGALEELKTAQGRNNGPPVTSGPLGPQGPTVNNMPANPAAPTVYTPVQEAHVLNDAILKAAMDLSQREKTRRKVIFIISDGREYRSQASYRDVLHVLLANNILVYGIGVGGAALPGYNKLAKLHIPRLGYTDILPRYANATGGEVFDELTRTGVEEAYTRAMGDARNQYTLGYLTRAAPGAGYRDIEVLVNRPGCRSAIRPCVNVYAKVGYYPAPPKK